MITDEDAKDIVDLDKYIPKNIENYKNKNYTTKYIFKFFH